jgi:YD repeat-containing protein
LLTPPVAVAPGLSKTVADTTYAAQVKDAVLTRDSAGRIMSAVENGVTVTYTRDSQGRIASETRNGKTTTYTRDGAGRVSGWATV